MREVAARSAAASGLAVDITIGTHAMRVDEPLDKGGTDTGPTPHELLLSALGACTAMTLRMYAERKGWPLVNAEVRVTGAHVDGRLVIEQRVSLAGELNDTQRARLAEIAGRCPVHRTLTGEVVIRSRLQDGA